VATCEGIPCTSPARTLVDLAAVATPRELKRALEQSLHLRIFDRRAMDATLGRATGRRGAGMLRRMLDELLDEPPVLKSELERAFLDLVREARLPRPIVNGYVAGHEVDFHWPTERLVVEADGRAAHGHALAFEEDRRRDLELASAGWQVVRVTWRQVTEEPERVTAMLAQTIAGGTGSPGTSDRPRNSVPAVVT
jgi:very-short-patch-repair endonuclease